MFVYRDKNVFTDKRGYRFPGDREGRPYNYYQTFPPNLMQRKTRNNPHAAPSVIANKLSVTAPATAKPHKFFRFFEYV